MTRGKNITEKTRSQRVKRFIARNRFFRDKYLKNTVYYCAAYDSWAARGQAGSCQSCGLGHYNVVYKNKRKWNKNLIVGSRKGGDEIATVCYACSNEIGKQLDYKFKRI